MIAPDDSCFGCGSWHNRMIFAFVTCQVFDRLGYGRAPEQIPNQMVFANVVAEEIDALMLLARICIVRGRRCCCSQSVQV